MSAPNVMSSAAAAKLPSISEVIEREMAWKPLPA